MKGGAVDFRMFEVHFVKGDGHDDLTQLEFRNANTLIGTLCYYPTDGDFYFCVYDSATSHVMMISIFHAICRLCGIDQTSKTTANLIIIPFQKKLYDETHPFYNDDEIEEEIPQTNNEYLKLKHRKGLIYADSGDIVFKLKDGRDSEIYKKKEGVHPIRACFVLKTRFGREPQLSFITYTLTERITRLHGSAPFLSSFDEPQYDNVKICTIPKMPDKLSNEDVIKFKLPSEERDGKEMGLVLVDLKTQDESLDSRRTFGFADYSLPVKAAMKARKMIDSHLAPVPQPVPGPQPAPGSTLNTTDGMVSQPVQTHRPF
jgi:hypothetical protein